MLTSLAFYLHPSLVRTLLPSLCTPGGGNCFAQPFFLFFFLFLFFFFVFAAPLLEWTEFYYDFNICFYKCNSQSKNKNSVCKSSPVRSFGPKMQDWDRDRFTFVLEPKKTGLDWLFFFFWHFTGFTISLSVFIQIMWFLARFEGYLKYYQRLVLNRSLLVLRPRSLSVFCGPGLFWSFNFPVFCGPVLVQFQSFAGPRTGLPNTK